MRARDDRAAIRTEDPHMPLDDLRNGYARASEAILKLREGL